MVTWVIVADSARARLFELKAEHAAERVLDEFDVIVSPEGRLHEGDLTADREGRSFDSRGRGRHRMEPTHTASEHAAEVFAKRLAEHIDDARVAGFVDKLVLVAAPKFLGLLRSNLDANARELVVDSIDKELTMAGPDEIVRHLPRIF